MFRFWKTVMPLILVWAFVLSVMAEDPPSTKGAKSLFGQGNDSASLPRGQGETTGSTEMNAAGRTTENKLASGTHHQPDFPGIAYSLEVIRRGEDQITTVEDPLRYEFNTGDRVRMRLVSNFTGFAYVLEVTSKTMSLVYPANFETKESKITVGTECYVPAKGWLRLVDPAEPFTMRVLFKPVSIEYPLRQPRQNSMVAQISLAQEVQRAWQEMAGQKGMIFEADRSYIGEDSQPQTTGQSETLPSIDRSNYTTHYVVVDRSQLDPALQEGQAAIAIEIPIRHVPR